MKKETRDALVAALATEVKDSVIETLTPRIDQILVKVEDMLKAKEAVPEFSEPEEIFGLLRVCLYKPEGETWWELNAYVNDEEIYSIACAPTKEELIKKWGLTLIKDTD